jgi:hypothetical protein
MAKNDEIPEDKEYEYKKDYESDWDIHRITSTNLTPTRLCLYPKFTTQYLGSVDGSKITDSYATTLAKERADRVMAKLPEGETEATGQADQGKAAFMDILRQKWIYPNANAQHPFLEKTQHVAVLLLCLRVYADVLRLERLPYRICWARLLAVEPEKS